MTRTTRAPLRRARWVAVWCFDCVGWPMALSQASPCPCCSHWREPLRVLVVRPWNVGVCGEDAPWTWGAGGLRLRARDCALGWVCMAGEISIQESSWAGAAGDGVCARIGAVNHGPRCHIRSCCIAYAASELAKRLSRTPMQSGRTFTTYRLVP